MMTPENILATQMMTPEDILVIQKLQKKSSALAQDISEYYLQPFDGSKKPNLYDGKLERISHGAQHINRTAGLIRPIWQFYCWLGDNDAINLTEEAIFLLEILARIHDIARKDDLQDTTEEQSAQFCYSYLISHGISHDTAMRFAYLIRKKEKGGVLGEIFQAADALDIMRSKRKLILKKISLYYNCKDRPIAFKAFLQLTVEVRALIAQQHDLKYACEIVVEKNGDPLLPSIPATRDPNKPELKVSYEQAKNCYKKIIADFKNYPLLHALRTENSHELLSVPPEPDVPLQGVRFVKSIRHDQYCYIEEETHDLTQHDAFSFEVERRLADKRKWMVTAEMGAVQTSKKPSTYPKQKEYYSSINSWSLVSSKEGEVPVFRFDKDEKSAGLILYPQDTLLHYLLVYDRASVLRPNHFDRKEEALAYYDKMVLEDKPKLYPRRLIRLFKARVLKNSEQHNEVLLRTRVHAERFHAAIFADNLGSRLLAQYYQNVALRKFKYFCKELSAFSVGLDEQALENLGKKINERGLNFIHQEKTTETGSKKGLVIILKKGFKFPIEYYLPKDKHKNEKIYSERAQLADRKQANEIWQNKSKRHQEIARDSFEFLLFIDPIEQIFDEKNLYQGIPLLLHILRQGYVHIAEELLLQLPANQLEKQLSKLTPYLRYKDLFATISSFLNKKSIDEENATYQEPAMPYLALKKDHTLWNWFKQQGADINSEDKDGNNSLLKTAIAGKAEQARYLMQQGLNVNHKNKKQHTALHYFVTWKQKAMVAELLQAGARVNTRDENQNTALHFASDKKYFELIKLLLEHKADIHAVDKNGWTPLHTAANNAHMAAVRLLLAKGAKVDAQNNIGQTPLHLVIQNTNDTALIKFLIEEGKADFNKITTNGWSAIHYAADTNNFEAFRYLVDQGANIHQVTTGPNIKWTVLNLAAQSSLKIVQFLAEEKKVNIHYLDKLPTFVLHVAALYGQLDTVKYLVKAGADINQKIITTNAFLGRNGWTAVDCAASQAHFETAKYLILDCHAKPGNDWENVSRIIEWAMEKNEIELFQYIGDYTNITNIEIKNQTILDLALKEKKIAIAKYLLKKGGQVIGISATDLFDFLEVVIEKEEFKILRLLLAYSNLILDTRNADEKTILDLLLTQKKMNIIKFLIKNGAACGKGDIQIFNLAINMDDSEMMHLLIDKKIIAIGDKYTNNWTVFHIAAKSGAIKIISYLLQYETVINDADKQKWTPLHHASFRGHLEVVKLLHLHGANVDALAENNQSVLYLSSKKHCDISKYLIKEAEARFKKDGQTAARLLQLALTNSDIELLVLLLENRIDPNLISDQQLKEILRLLTKDKIAFCEDYPSFSKRLNTFNSDPYSMTDLLMQHTNVFNSKDHESESDNNLKLEEEEEEDGTSLTIDQSAP